MILRSNSTCETNSGVQGNCVDLGDRRTVVRREVSSEEGGLKISREESG